MLTRIACAVQLMPDMTESHANITMSSEQKHVKCKIFLEHMNEYFSKQFGVSFEQVKVANKKESFILKNRDQAQVKSSMDIHKVIQARSKPDDMSLQITSGTMVYMVDDDQVQRKNDNVQQPDSTSAGQNSEEYLYVKDFSKKLLTKQESETEEMLANFVGTEVLKQLKRNSMSKVEEIIG